MGSINENPTWESQVKQIEYGEPVGGGPDAPANIQAKHLANRTVYLKKEQDSLKNRVGEAEEKLGEGSLSDCLEKDKNLADLPDKAAARENLGVPSTNHNHDARYARRSGNLSDLDNKDQARSNIGAASSQHGHAMDQVTGLQNALNGKQAVSQKNQPGGYAGLDAGGKVSSEHLPDRTTIGGHKITYLIKETRDPRTGDDAHPIGTQWMNTATKQMFRCLSNETGKAEWLLDISLRTTLRDGLVLEYTMDPINGTTLNDTSGNGIDGTISGATVIPGKKGNALSFDGVDDFVQSDHEFSLADIKTVAFWVRGGDSNDTETFFSVGKKMASCGQFHSWLCITEDWESLPAGHIGFGYRSNGGGSLRHASFPCPDTTDWRFFVMEFSGVQLSTSTAFRAWVDNVEQSLTFTSGSVDPLPIGGGFGLGRNHGRNVFFTQGQIDQFRTWNRMLTDAERSALYNNGEGM